MKTTYPEALDALFKDHLDGKLARVKASGLNIEGTIQADVSNVDKKNIFLGL